MTAASSTACGLRLRPTLRSTPVRKASIRHPCHSLVLLRSKWSPDSSSPSLRSPSSSSSSFPSARSSSSAAGWSSRGAAGCSAAGGGGGGSAQGETDYECRHAVYPRPAAIPWQKDLANTVHLIGVVGAPVQIKHVSSGKVLAWTRLGVKSSASDTVWINLTLWDELAQTAFQHMEKGQQIYVCGRLVSDSVEGDGEKRQVYYKVVVQQLNFVEKSFLRVSSYDPEASSLTKVVRKTGSNAGNEGSSPEELWQAFFANPADWWDNRKKKKNPKAPDFKHKHTGEALWIEGRYNPIWVKSQLAILDSRMNELQADDAKVSLSFMDGGKPSYF